jgi:membrane protein YdbS with pleckstrin-like domain
LGTYIGLGVIKEGQGVDMKKNAHRRIPKWVFNVLLFPVLLAGLFVLSDMFFTAGDQFYKAILVAIMIVLTYLYILFVISDDDRPLIVG